MSAAAHFALHSALSSVVKHTDARCGAIFSFWRPHSATLSSVELSTATADKDNMDDDPFRFARSCDNVVNINDSSSLARNQFLRQVQMQDERSSCQNGSMASATNQNDNNDAPKSPLVKRRKPLPSGEEEGEDIGGDEVAGRLLNLLDETKKQQQGITHHDDDDDAFENFSFSPSPEVAAIASAAVREVSVDTSSKNSKAQQAESEASDMNAKAAKNNEAPPAASDPAGISQTLRRHELQQQLQLQKNLTMTPAATASARAARSNDALSRCIALYGDPSDLLARATTPEIQHAVARSGLAVHNTSNTSSYLIIPIVASTLLVETQYSAVTRRMLQLNKFNKSQVVVGMLVLIGKEPKGGDYDDDSASEKSSNNHHRGNESLAAKAKRRVDELMTMTMTPRQIAKKEKEEQQRSIDKRLEHQQNLDSVLLAKHVAFRAEDESLAEVICRTVLSELLTTKEGVYAKEHNLNIFLNKQSQQQRQQAQHDVVENSNINIGKIASQHHQPSAAFAGCIRTPTKAASNANNFGDDQNLLISSSCDVLRVQTAAPKRGSGLSNQLTASFRGKSRAAEFNENLNNNNHNDSGILPAPQLPKRLELATTTTAAAAASSVRKVANSFMINSDNNNNFHSSLAGSASNAMLFSGNTLQLFNNNNNQNAASNSNNLLQMTDMGAAVEYAAGTAGPPGNSAGRFMSLAAHSDFARSTLPRRVPKIIRTPDSAIFLTSKQLLSQKPGTFSALPDLPEVRRVIEEGEKVIDDLRDENMNLRLATQRGTKRAGGGAGVVFSVSGDAMMHTSNSNNSGDGGDLREGMEKLELRLSKMRTENTALRNHIDMLTHRLDTTLRQKSIVKEFPPPPPPHSAQTATTASSSSSYASFLSTLGAQLFETDASSNRRNFAVPAPPPPPLHSTSSSSSYHHSSSGFARVNSARASASRRESSRGSAAHNNNNSSCGDSSVTARKRSSSDLPASVLLECKAVEGLDRLKLEMAFQQKQRKFNS